MSLPATQRMLAALLLSCGLVLAAARAPALGGTSTARPKRGVASGRYISSDPAKLDALGASWAYDWSATPPRVRAGARWVGMIWGQGSLSARTLAALGAARRAGHVRELLGFNEPDSPSQSNLSPERAAALWPALQSTGLRLGSPAPVVPTDGWLSRFMALARGRHLRVDFIALHYYQDFTDPGAVPSLQRQLIALHDEYGKPIWITEIGALDIRRWHEPMLHAPTAFRARAYMRALFAMLDRLRFVERYAWFMDQCWTDLGCRASSLFDARGRPSALAGTFRTSP